jgi:hypothetical protein
MAKINPFSNFTTEQPRQKHENQKKNVAELEEIKKALEYASVETQYLIKRGNIKKKKKKKKKKRKEKRMAVSLFLLMELNIIIYKL